ncbi:MAG: phage terminase large subunit [Candidatus Competibacteraceae bacterium]|nr:phage terminase large subunit [Candidatus Competibacteraceae bacterium]
MIPEGERWRAYPHTFAAKASSHTWKPYAWTRYVSSIIGPAILRGDARIIVKAPPQHGKSEMISVWTPLWFMDHFPEKRVILASYSREVSGGFSRRVRNEMLSNNILRSDLSYDSSSSFRFHTTKGGGMYATSATGSLTSKGGDLILIDDPYKDNAEANSAAHRKKIEEWVDFVVTTRLQPGGSLILLMTHWHEKDLTHYLKQKGGFTEICLPAIAGKNDPMGRLEGEPLCPERYDLKALEKIRDPKTGVGSYAWNALYQQSPIPLEGGLFKRHWWKRYDQAPEIQRKVMFIDAAQKPGISNDYSVCATWAQCQNGFYLLDIWRNKVETPQLEAAVKGLFEKHRPHAVVIEDKSAGSALIQYLRNTRIPVLPYNPGIRDKQTRATAATPLVESGRCFLPNWAPWVEDFVLEHESFPAVDHDDQVDTTSMLAEYFNTPVPVPRARSL